MKLIKNRHYAAPFFFFFIYLGLLNAYLVVVDHPQSEAAFIVISRFVLLAFFMAGIYIVAFIYGLYYEMKYKLTFSQLALSTGIVFLLLLVGFWPIWKPNLSTDDLNLKYFLMQVILQGFCFLIGCMLPWFVLRIQRTKGRA